MIDTPEPSFGPVRTMSVEEAEEESAANFYPLPWGDERDEAAPAAAADPEAEWARMTELARAATPGPWVKTGGDAVFAADKSYPLAWFPDMSPDTAYVAYASPDRLLRLLGERDRLARELAYVRLIATGEGEPNRLRTIVRIVDAALSAATGHGDPEDSPTDRWGRTPAMVELQNLLDSDEEDR